VHVDSSNNRKRKLKREKGGFVSFLGWFISWKNSSCPQIGARGII
jgi:hypothetical protein